MDRREQTATPMDSPIDSIEILNLRLRARIGFSPHELDTWQDVVINLRLGSIARLAGESDDPADALNYKPISKAIIQLVSSRRFALLEKLAEEVACLAIGRFGAACVEVSVHKPGALRHSDSVGVRIARQPADYARNIAYIALGSNIAPEQNLRAAIALLRAWTTLLALSPVYRSPPQGDRQQADFLNMAVKLHTVRAPLEFKRRVIDRIETALKRQRAPHNVNAPRSIDLDIALWNEEALEYGGKPWRIPDPDIVRYAHVAVPLAELAPGYRHPQTGESLRKIAARLDANGMKKLDFDFDEKLD
ncbi:MAG: 2-amino-4-hydroxy-6-hydroxymethyldihydropteridine diphosphokinase [Chloroflexi bacterium]|nr:2-amino-4-hydroxy-6-hydroxymethyldihydropteridine diphosphokinase [Chloroflexota bacterium]